MSGGTLEQVIQTGFGGLSGIVATGIWHAAKNRGRWQSFDNFLRDWNGEPPRKGVPARPGVMERLASLETQNDERRDIQEQQASALSVIGAAVEQLSAWMEGQRRPPMPPQQGASA